MTRRTEATTTNAAAWMFCLEHSKLIDRMSKKSVHGTTLRFEDFRGELLADLASTFTKYDPSRGAGPSTWIFMRSRAVKRGMVRASVRGTAVSLTRADGDDFGAAELEVHDDPSLRTSAAGIERRAELRLIVDRATDTERQMIGSILTGSSIAETAERTGFTVRQQYKIIERMRARL